MQQLLLDIHPIPEPGFDNFVAGRNAHALEAVRRAAADAATTQTIYLWGASGSGRTHLLQSAVALAAGKGRQLLTVPPFQAPASGAPEGALVVADDMEHLAAADQHALFTLFNVAREMRLTILMAGNAPPQVLPLREDLRTRVGAALVFELHPLSDNEMAAALIQTARRRGMRIDREIVDYLLRRERRELPYLSALLEALDRTSLARHRAPTLPLLRELLANGER